LSIRWLRHEYKKDFALNKQPPEHMPIVYGLVQIVTLKKKDKDEYAKLTNNFRNSDICFICKLKINTDAILNKHLNGLKCLNCDIITHTICLANKFKSNHYKEEEEQHFLPVSGKCPKCEVHLMWGDLIKYRLSLYKKNVIDKNDLEENEEQDDEEFVERDEDSD
jgi:hypothetical protein